MDLDVAKDRLSKFKITLDKKSAESIVSFSDETDIEGLYKLLTINKKNSQKSLIWDMSLKCVITPIVINNAGLNYFLLATQSRMIFSGKVTIEIYRGFTNEGIDDQLLWNYLLERKIPYLHEYMDIVKIVELGSFYQHPDISVNTMATQLVFAKTKEPFSVDELKHNLRVRHEYSNEPLSGPPLHNNEPTLKSFEEIEQRLTDIIQNPEKTSDEFYINDVFSITALYKTLTYIKDKGLPF